MEPVSKSVRVLANDAVIMARMFAPMELTYWQGAIMALTDACRENDAETIAALLNWTFSPYAWDKVEAREA